MDPEEATDLLAAAGEMLAVLWTRAMNNDLTPAEVRALRQGCMAIAITRSGAKRVMPFPNWNTQ